MTKFQCALFLIIKPWLPSAILTLNLILQIRWYLHETFLNIQICIQELYPHITVLLINIWLYHWLLQELWVFYCRGYDIARCLLSLPNLIGLWMLWNSQTICGPLIITDCPGKREREKKKGGHCCYGDAKFLNCNKFIELSDLLRNVYKYTDSVEIYLRAYIMKITDKICLIVGILFVYHQEELSTVKLAAIEFFIQANIRMMK